MEMIPVLVTWRDAHAVFQSWADPEHISEGDFICETIGWKLPDDVKPGWVVVVLSRTHEGLVGDGIAIPEAMVVKTQELKVKNNS